jgi:16S rRNA U1498 N3-methylase RsmE
MNLILLTANDRSDAGDGLFVVRDERAAHLRGVLRAAIGDTFSAGLEDGPRGRAREIKI